MSAVADWFLPGLLRATIGLSIAGLVVAALVFLLRIRAPRAEQWAWLFVLIQGLVFAPLALPVPERWIAAGPLRVDDPIPATQVVGTQSVATVEPSTPEAEVSRDEVNPPATSEATLPAPIEYSVQPPPRRFSWMVATMIVWFCGTGGCLGLGLWRYFAFVRALSRAHTLAVIPSAAAQSAPGPVHESFVDWREEWRQVLADQRIATTIPVVITASIGPAICRVWNEYRLVLPTETWSNLAPAERQAILRHELAHLQRGDLWTTLVVRFLASLHWFNPLAWWAAIRFEAQSEFLCDEAGAAGDPATYAAVLLRLGATRAPALAGVTSARSGRLVDRLRRLLGDLPRTPRWRSAILLCLALTTIAVSATRLKATGDPAQPANTAQTGSRSALDRKLPAGALLQIGNTDLQTPERHGRLEGQIRFVGELPERPNLARLPIGLVVPDESLEVDPSERGIANVFVYLRKAPRGVAIPPAPEEPVTVRMVGMRFAPHATAVRVGQTLRVVNLDLQPGIFETYPLEHAPVKWMFKPGMQQELTYDKPQRFPVQTRNGMALLMRGTHLVLDHPWFAITDSEGRFTIRDLPPGRHEFILWHEHAGYLDRKWVVEVAPGETIARNAEFDLTRFLNLPAKPAADKCLSAGPFDIEQVGFGDDIVAGRHLLAVKLADRLDRLHQCVDLTDDQRRSLELAGVEEIEQLLREVQRIRNEFQRVSDDPAQLKVLLEEDLPQLRERLSFRLFDLDSPIGRSVKDVLTSDQMGRLKDRYRAARDKAAPRAPAP